MNRRAASLCLGLVSALCVAFMATVALQQKAPGPVSAVHAGLAAIAGGSACSQCHGGWFGDMQSACLQCHADIAGQLESGNGLHGRLQESLAGNCAHCHGEHHGDGFKLVNRLAFAEAGVPDPKAFDHTLVGLELAGRHTELGCVECHVHAEAEVLAEGQKRFLGLSRDCASCHQDPHGGRMQHACATCHSQTDWQQRDVAWHQRILPLDGGHAGLDCRTCHQEESLHALERLQPGASSARGCTDCHVSPHGDAFVRGNAAAAGVAVASSCTQCHPFTHQRFADPATTVTPEQHRHGGFALTAPHAEAACADCHQPGASWAERHPGRRASDCRSCHQDPHGGQFDSGPHASLGCVACHTETHFQPPKFDVEAHQQTRFALDGAHLDAECHSCHTAPQAGAPRQFRDTPNRCEACHQDGHADRFAPHAAELAKNPRGSCAECHGTDAFANVDHRLFDHGKWTGLPLHGAHAQIECTDCHEQRPDTGPLRRLGRIPTSHGGAAACTTCHHDPHGGLFDRDAALAVVDGRQGCERCHDSVSFRALPFGFDHGRFTGYALTGAHAALDCTACHPPVDGPPAAGRPWARPKGRECADCHQDPHAGQFERLGANDCSRCHKSTVGFGVLSFRHNLDSRFPLSEAHSQVACAGCHKPERIGGANVVRYKPLPTDCVACHGNDAALRRRED